MYKKELEKVKAELQRYINLKLYIKLADEYKNIYEFIDSEGKTLTYADMNEFDITDELNVRFQLNKIEKNFKFPYIYLEVNNGVDFDLSHKFNGLSIEEIKSKYDYKERLYTVRSISCDRIIMTFDSHINLIEIKKIFKDRYYNTISNEGGEDIKFFEKDNKYYEYETKRKIKGLLDIGGQHCVRLIPILV